MSTSTKDKARISNPQRILVLTPRAHSHATIPPFLHCLTGVPVADTHTTKVDAEKESEGTENDDGGPKDPIERGPPSFAGYTTHSPLSLDTKYYTADVPIWVDEISLSTSPDSSSAPASASAAAPANDDAHTDPTSLSPGHPSTWKSEFLSAEAREVRDAIATLVLCIRAPDPVSRAIPAHDDAAVQGRKDVEAQIEGLKEFVRAVASVKERIDEERGGLGDVATLLVLVGSGRAMETRKQNDEQDEGAELEQVGGETADFGPTWWEDELSDMGIFDFEVVSWSPGENKDEMRRNEFGELEGMPRIREILEATEWTSSTADDGNPGDILGDMDEGDGFNLEVGELEREMFGLRTAIENGGEADVDDDDDDIKDDQLEALMTRVQAIRDMGSDIPEAERKSFAAKAIRDIMKDL